MVATRLGTAKRGAKTDGAMMAAAVSPCHKAMREHVVAAVAMVAAAVEKNDEDQTMGTIGGEEAKVAAAASHMRTNVPNAQHRAVMIGLSTVMTPSAGAVR